MGIFTLRNQESSCFWLDYMPLLDQLGGLRWLTNLSQRQVVPVFYMFVFAASLVLGRKGKL